MGTNYRTAEELLLYIEIHKGKLLPDDVIYDHLPVENYLLRILGAHINALNAEYVNINKDVHDKASFEAQKTNELVIKRNGMVYNGDKESFVIKINFNVPLIKALNINSKSTFKAVKSILDLADEKVRNFNREECRKYIETYIKQQEIRAYLKANNLAAFVADGSILPRENGTALPMKNAIPFKSPESLRRTITFSDRSAITGMAIPHGVTVITGGGYSGKSTLLDAIEMGIYNHIPNDGREFVITDDTALKIYAEDGRPVHNIDISPFFKYLPNGADVKSFSSLHASGSVSQAANIIEAVCAGCKLLLIDEDRSATNFMIRDSNMRKVVKKEPIIPFTDRVRELSHDKGVSTILVIGGSSEYLSYADTVILMDDYVAKDITEEVKNLPGLHAPVCEEMKANWMNCRYLIPKKTSQPFLYFKLVSTENAKKIVLDEYSSDIAMLTAIVSEYQLNALTFMTEQLLCDKYADRAELIEILKAISNKMYSSEIAEVILPVNFKIDRWFEAVRPIDIFCCINRMRGLCFRNEAETVMCIDSYI